MFWWGKIVGGVVGLTGGPLGAMVGAFLGHQFDRLIERQLSSGAFNGASQEQIQSAFFSATFSVMGHLAKSDGRVSEQEIAHAEAVMARLRLDESTRKVAVGLFQNGKRSDFDLSAQMQQFASVMGRQPNLSRMFLEIQILACMADGAISTNELQILRRIAGSLGVSELELTALIRMMQAQGQWQRARAQQSGGHGYQRAGSSRAVNTVSPYQVLGLEPSASFAEVKKAYRKLMSQHHPDKLVAKGLPEDMIKLATDKTQEIQAAYETIKDARNGR